jgi:lysophospholipase L1-like esterase
MVSTRNLYRLFPAVLLALAACAACPAQNPSAAVWVASWGASQQIPEPQNALPSDDLRDATLRQIFHLSVGGSTLRVHLSNAFGTIALRFTSVHIARPLAPDTSSIDPATDRALTFNGAPAVTVPPGAEYISDPIAFPAAPLSDVAVSFHLDEPPAPETSHPGSRATSYYVHGDAVAATLAAAAKPAAKIDHWYQVSAIDVLAASTTESPAASIVALGDSITDGHASTTNGNNRWTDELARRLQQSPATRAIGVSNQGLGGNHLLTDGLGPNVLARFDRDVLAVAAVRWVIVFEGVNDLGALARSGPAPPAAHAALVQRILGAYQQIVARAHAHGIQVIAATITPWAGSDYYHPDPENEADRQAVNAWIRAPGHFDAVIDFDKVLRDPAQPDRLLPALDCGDHLHPSPAGYKAIGDAIPLSLFMH